MLFSFGKFLLDTETRELRRDRELLSVEPRVFDLLSHLIVNRERVVSKDDLIAGVWKGRIVSDAAMTTCLNAARTAIADSGEEQRLIKTLPRKGFRFVGAVQEANRPAQNAAGSDSHVESTKPVLALPDKPSIAVLPFQNMSGDPEQEYFADGMVDDIITELSHYKSLFVVSRNSSFTYKGKAVDIKQVGRELGVRYVLEGSVRKAGGRVRITAQLIDTTSGAHIWAARFDREMADVFALQDDVTRSVISAVEPSLHSAEIARTNKVPTQDLNAYDLALRARAELPYTKDSVHAADVMLRRAIELDSHYSDAWALLTEALAFQYSRGWHTDDEAPAEIRQTALTATRVGPENGFAHALASKYLAFYGGSLDQCVVLAKRAIVLHPNSDEVRTSVGFTYVWNGEFETALEHLEVALRMAPLGPRSGRIFVAMSHAYFFQRNFDEAINQADKASTGWPYIIGAWPAKTAALAYLGRMDEAHAALQHLITVSRRVSLSTARLNYRHQWMRDLLFDGLRKAGHP